MTFDQAQKSGVVNMVEHDAPLPAPLAAPAQGEADRIGGFRITPEGLKMNGVLPPTKEESDAYLAHERADLISAVARLTIERDEARAERDSETKWAKHYLAGLEQAESELETLRRNATRDQELIESLGDRAEKAEAELAGDGEMLWVMGNIYTRMKAPDAKEGAGRQS